MPISKTELRRRFAWFVTLLLLDGVTVFVMHIFAKQRQPATDFGPALTIVFVFGLPFWYAVLKFFDAVRQPAKPSSDGDNTAPAAATPMERFRPKFDKIMRIAMWLVISFVTAMMIMLHLEVAGSGH